MSSKSSYAELERVFNAAADTYDENERVQGWRTNEMVRNVLGGLSIAPQTVLDLGAGTGETVRSILDRFQPQRVEAVDLSTGMISKLLQKFGNDSRVHATVSPIGEYLAQTTQKYDLVTAVGVIPNISDPQLVINGVANCLTEGGHFVFSYAPIIALHPVQSVKQCAPLELPVYLQTIDEMERLISRGGLRKISNDLFSSLPHVDPSKIGGIVVAERPIR